MSKSIAVDFRYRYGRFMSRYQYDLKRILDDGKLHLVSKFFQDGTWESLAPQTRASFIARCARLKPQDVTLERDARELRCILDALPAPSDNPGLKRLLLAVLDRWPQQPEQFPPTDTLVLFPGQSARRRRLPKDFLKNTDLPVNPGPEQIRAIHEQLVNFSWEEYDDDPIVLNQYAIRLNDLAHHYQTDERGYRAAITLFRLKAQVLLRIIEKHFHRVSIYPEGTNIVRVRVNSRHGAGLHILMRDLPEHLRETYRDESRSQSSKPPG